MPSDRPDRAPRRAAPPAVDRVWTDGIPYCARTREHLSFALGVQSPDAVRTCATC